jgi:hypothetical protein
MSVRRRVRAAALKLIRVVAGHRPLSILLALALLAILLPNVSPAAPVRANPGPTTAGSTTTNFSSSNRSSATFSHTVPDFPDRLLLVVIHMEGTRVVNSVTFGGTALTRAIQTDSLNTARAQVQIWYLAAPAAQTANVVVTYSANQDWDGITVLNYTGVHQTAPIGNSAGQTIGTASTLASQVLTTKNYDSLIVAAVTGPGGNTYPMTPGASMTERSDFRTGTGAAGSDGGCWTGDRPAGSSNTAYTSSATLSASARWTMAAVEIVPPSTTSEVTWQGQTINSSSANRNNATFSHTTPTGDNRLLVVIVHLEGTRVVNSVTYNGAALTLQRTQDSGSNTSTQIRIYTLTAPPMGAFNVVVTYSANQDWDAVVAMSYSGVHQTTPVGGKGGSTLGAASYIATTILSTVADSLLVGAVAGASGASYPMLQGGGQNERYDARTGTGAAGADAGFSGSEMPAPIAATYGFGATKNAAVASVVAVIELIPAPIPNITEDTISFNFQTVSEGSSTLSGLTAFRVRNFSGFAVNISISATDMTGGATWTLSDNATAGPDIYGLKAGRSGTAYNIIVKKNAPYNILVSNLASGNSQQWGLQLLAPTTFSDEVTKQGTVTLTAVAA